MQNLSSAAYLTIRDVSYSTLALRNDSELSGIKMDLACNSTVNRTGVKLEKNSVLTLRFWCITHYN